VFCLVVDHGGDGVGQLGSGRGRRVEFQDAGVGLDIESINKLFDAFYTTKTDGMGIGSP